MDSKPTMERGKFERAGQDLGRLVDEKQEAYGDSVRKSGEIMKILYPSGVPVESMKDALLVVRVIDKLSRIATDKDALGESPWHDIGGYGLLGLANKLEGATWQEGQK